MKDEETKNWVYNTLFTDALDAALKQYYSYMKHKITWICICCFISLLGMAQQPSMLIKGTVKEQSTLRPIRDVEIRIVGGQSVFTDHEGAFRIQARIGDELMISDDRFETVFYRIENDEVIDVIVADESTASSFSSSKTHDAYFEYLNAAKSNLKKDAATSIDFVRKALETIRDKDRLQHKKKATLYEVLGDIYSYWKQPDFAEENYLNSLMHVQEKDVQIKLGHAQLDNANFELALGTFNEVSKARLNTMQQLKVYEGRGDAYKGLRQTEQAVAFYDKALALAQKKGAKTLIIELNSKLAEVVGAQGNFRKAESYLDSSVALAERKSKRTSARQRAKAADFYNKNSSYDKEIALRKEALEDIVEMEAAAEAEAVSESLETNKQPDSIPKAGDAAITSQVQNYKIANAFVAKRAYDEALPYLEESIKKAASVNDLVVQKDATRKLGEVLRQKGQLKEASEAFESYGAIVDKLHAQKEQEISQSERFRKELIKKANRITTLEKDRELHESRYKLAIASRELVGQQSSKQQIVIYSLIVLAVLLFLAAYLMYRNMKQQQYANDLLALKSLRSQMNPHFIFNALNSVNTFIATSDERAANKYLTEFSLLMRSVLENSEENVIPLEKEIALLELYVKLEHFRFQDKFEYEIYIDPTIDVTSYMIPPMLLQPYIENAVWHGLRYKKEKGMLSIRMEQRDAAIIEIMITDDGIGRAASRQLKTANQKKQKSKGMSNIQERIQILNRMYKGKVDVTISDVYPTHGTQVVLRLNKPN